MCLSLFVTTSLSLSLCLYLTICLYLPLYLSIHLSNLSIYLSIPIYLSIYISIHLSTCLFYVSISLSTYLSIHLSLSLSIYLSCIYLSVYLSIHPSISTCLSISLSLSIYLSIYLSTSISLSIDLSRVVGAARFCDSKLLPSNRPRQTTHHSAAGSRYRHDPHIHRSWQIPATPAALLMRPWAKPETGRDNTANRLKGNSFPSASFRGKKLNWSCQNVLCVLHCTAANAATSRRSSQARALHRACLLLSSGCAAASKGADTSAKDLAQTQRPDTLLIVQQAKPLPIMPSPNVTVQGANQLNNISALHKSKRTTCIVLAVTLGITSKTSKNSLGRNTNPYKLGIKAPGPLEPNYLSCVPPSKARAIRTSRDLLNCHNTVHDAGKAGRACCHPGAGKCL